MSFSRDSITVQQDVMMQLHDMSAVTFGSFVLKSGLSSPVYFDLRGIVSYPSLMELLAEVLWSCKPENVSFDCLCGVPYTALPLASIMSVKHGLPMVMKRKEGAKEYGTKKAIEGKFSKGQNCLILEDVVTSGSSVLETVNALRAEGLVVTDAIVLIDREQGGKENMKKHGVQLHSFCTLSQLLHFFHREGKIDWVVLESVQKFINENQVGILKKTTHNCRLHLEYKERSKSCINSVAAKLFELMDKKKTNLCVAVDVTSGAQLLKLAEELGPYICILKLHINIVEDFNLTLTDKLQELAAKHNFLMFEDAKLADIGNTVSRQYSRGLYKIVDWADLVTVHCLPGMGLLEGLKESAKSRHRGALLVAEMSSKGNLCTSDYTKAALSMAEAHSDFVTGFICQSPLSSCPGYVYMTPGVNISVTSDQLGQGYIDPETAVKERGADVIIVGRGIYQADDVIAAAQRYRDAGWKSYEERISENCE